MVVLRPLFTDADRMMKILSDHTQDAAWPKSAPGGYEWWYFDAIDPETGFKCVVIFYRGNPFSTRYIRQSEQSLDAMPGHYPAVSISIYEGSDPIYYSFQEFEPAECSFPTDEVAVRIGNHRLKQSVGDDGFLSYLLELEETLPSGDQITAELTFTSRRLQHNVARGDHNSDDASHLWNLVQPRADVTGSVALEGYGNRKKISVNGTGYHDHNVGFEPMKDDFTDWYWGRFHADGETLIYYAMNRTGADTDYHAWLINEADGAVKTASEISFADRGVNLFGLSNYHQLEIRADHFEASITQGRLLDNGPFYRRYLANAFIRLPGENRVVGSVGISEYIRPSRIYSKLFWPLVHMRIRYRSESPHWVQKSPRLYRWTW